VIRIATIEDIDLIVKMSMKFMDTCTYKDYSSESKIKEVVTNLLNASKSDGIILISEDKGFIAGVAKEFTFGDVRIATELAWWVEPEHRASKVGKELLDAFEYWAEQVGCKAITMICLDENLSQYYEKRGYVLAELAYMKDL
jgi:GNAT superfamily N-acetyltransferase